MEVKCAVINDLLPLYVDDVLSKESRELVEEHIKDCESCRKTLENMKGKISIPVNAELRMDETKSLKGLKRNVDKWKWLVAFVAVFAFIVITVLGVLYMTSKEITIPYDGKNIAVELIEDEYHVVCHERGVTGFSAVGDFRSGEYEIEITSTLWDKYIVSIFHPNDIEDFWICEKGEITKLIMSDGTVVWEANEEQMKAHEEWVKVQEEIIEDPDL